MDCVTPNKLKADSRRFRRLSQISKLRSAYKPHSVQHWDSRAPLGRSSLWDAPLGAPRAAYPGHAPLMEGGDEQPPARQASFVPAWPCSWWGLPGRAHYWARRWSLKPPFHPYRQLRPKPQPLRRFVSVARSGRLPRPGSYPAPRSGECGLSSTPRSAPRPSGQPFI